MNVFEALEVRDTSPHNSNVYDMPNPEKRKLIIYKNTHNQALTLQVQGCWEKSFANPVNIGNSFTAASGMGSYLYEWLREPWQYLRLVATAAVTPTSGNIDARIE